jgi:hypothetical protein
MFSRLENDGFLAIRFVVISMLMLKVEELDMFLMPCSLIEETSMGQVKLRALVMKIGNSSHLGY